jgi:hypothetical protein
MGLSSGNMLGHGQGILYPDKAISWALAIQETFITKVEHTIPQHDNNADWHLIADSIVSYRPIIIIIRTPITAIRHACCASGVRIDDNGVRWLYFSDPENESPPEWRRFSIMEIDSLYTASNPSVSGISARQVDITVIAAGDTDGDGLMTFDEALGRFSMQPYNLSLNRQLLY